MVQFFTVVFTANLVIYANAGGRVRNAVSVISVSQKLTAKRFNHLNIVVTICTARFNIQQFYVLSTQCICVLCGSQNKQRLFHCTTLTDWFV
jgi:hypothetical protein